MKRFFNTAGPINLQDHYCLPPLERLNLNYIISLIEQKKYFVLHAPRQTGKTSSLLALMEHLNRGEKYKCLYINVEIAQVAREDVKRGIRSIIDELGSRLKYSLKDEFIGSIWPDVLRRSGEDRALNEILTQWASENSKPLVLLIDEIDSLLGDTLISVLRQLRAGYDKRPSLFPQCVVLCGVRDVRDYRIHSDKEKAIIAGGSAFNIKSESLRLGNFSKKEIVRLYEQHTEETGQTFSDGVLNLMWELTEGQPWLVNALAYEACFKIEDGCDRSKPITVDIIYQAKENIILKRETHIDQLVDKLKEDRVKKVIQPLLAGWEHPERIPVDDISYVCDLGLITTEGQIKIANKIYQEIIPRELIYSTQLTISQQPGWYITQGGILDINKLLLAFQEFFRKHSEHWVERFDYKEAGPQLLLQAFLQRIVNGGGRVEREYGLGRMRTDLLLIWPHSGGDNIKQNQKVVIELKILYNSLKKTEEDGLKQTSAYMDKCGTDEGHLIIFDRNPEKEWDKKIFKRKKDYQGKDITIWGM